MKRHDNHSPHFELLTSSDIFPNPNNKPPINNSIYNKLTKVNKRNKYLYIILFIIICFFLLLTIPILQKTKRNNELHNKMNKLSQEYFINLENKTNLSNNINENKEILDKISIKLSNVNAFLINLQEENKKLKTDEMTLHTQLCYAKFSLESKEHDDFYYIKEIERIRKQRQQIEQLQHLYQNNSNNKPKTSLLDSDIITSQNEIASIEKWIKGRIGTICYSSRRDTLSGDIFLKQCENVFPSIVLIRISANNIFGGFTTKPWKSKFISRDDHAFIFSLTNDIIFPINQGQFATSTIHDNLPSFGLSDIVLNQSVPSISQFPHSYGDSSDQVPNLLTNGVISFSTFDIEVISLL